MNFDVVFVVVLFAWALLVLGVLVRNFVVCILSGMLLVVAAIFVGMNGFLGVNSFVTDAFTIVMLGVGFFVLIESPLEQLVEVES